MSEAGSEISEKTAMRPKEELEKEIVEALKTCFDPEIPINIYDLGLIYEVEVQDEGVAKIIMTLTSPNCPAAEMIPQDVHYKVLGVEGIEKLDLQLTFEPPWDPTKLSDEAKLSLGML